MTDYKKYIREGKGRSDLTGLFANPEILNSAIEDMAKPFLDQKINKVVALDALGFIFGTRIAEKLNVGLVLVRKSGKIGVKTKSISFTDYTKTEKSFEIAVDAIKPNDKVLIVDDWSETGSQLKATITLVESIEGNVIGVSCFNIDKPVFNDSVLSKYKLYSALKD